MEFVGAETKAVTDTIFVQTPSSKIATESRSMEPKEGLIPRCVLTPLDNGRPPFKGSAPGAAGQIGHCPVGCVRNQPGVFLT